MSSPGNDALGLRQEVRAPHTTNTQRIGLTGAPLECRLLGPVSQVLDSPTVLHRAARPWKNTGECSAVEGWARELTIFCGLQAQAPPPPPVHWMAASPCIT